MKNGRSRICVKLKDLIFISATSFTCGAGALIIIIVSISEGHSSFFFGSLSLLLLLLWEVGAVMAVINERREKDEIKKDKINAS